MKTPIHFFVAAVIVTLSGVASAEMRTWTSASDATKTFEAEFRSATADTVDLIGKDGRLMKVKLEVLSQADRDYVKEKAESGGGAPSEVATSAMGSWDLVFEGKRGYYGQDPTKFSGPRKMEVAEQDGKPVVTGRLFQNGELSVSTFEPGRSFRITERYKLGGKSYSVSYSGKVSADGSTIEDGKFRHVSASGVFTGTKKQK